MKRKQLINSSQTLPIKVLFLSYLAHNEIASLMSDCHNAVDQRISKLSSSIQQNFKQIQQIVGQDFSQNGKSRSIKSNNDLMQVIQEEQYGTTERDTEQYQAEKFVQNQVVEKLKRKFNESIKMLERSSTKYEHIIYLYKKELTDIAKELTRQKEINQKITKELTQITKEKSYRSTSVSKFTTGKTSLGSTINKTIYLPYQGKLKDPKIHQEQQSQDEDIRPPPKPFCQECQVRQKQNQKKAKEALQERNKWRNLSTQIMNLKDQLSRYEQQLINKQSEINKLTEQLKKLKEDEGKAENQEKKKLRTMNTTLRGEKIVLENQISILKKKHEENQELFSVTESQNKKLMIENQNLTGTIKWQQNTIQDLRKNFSTGVKQEGQLMKKFRELQQQNQILSRQIQDQQKYLEQFVQKLQQIQATHEDDVKKLGKKIIELENIIEQKNETIVKMKIESRREENNPIAANNLLDSGQRDPFVQIKPLTRQSGILKSRDDPTFGVIMNKTLRKQNACQNQGFQENMIKLLNKKIVDKDETIQKLLKQIQQLKEQLEVYINQ